MVNEFITRLANLPGPSQPITESPFDLYRPSYEPIKSDDTTHVFVRYILFGDCVTESDIKVRAFLLAKVVSTTEISHYIKSDDQRVTYSWRFPLNANSSTVPGLPSFDIDQINKSHLDRLLSERELAMQFNLGTYFDKLAAIVVGLVIYEKSLKK